MDSDRKHRREMLRIMGISAASIALTPEIPHANVKGVQPDNEGGGLVLEIRATEENPRNSEGAFITLEDGRILFFYTYFYGGSEDHGAANISAIESKDGGRTWSREPKVIIENYGGQNVMSVSLLRLQNGAIALFYAVKNSIHDCCPVMQISTDEAGSWSTPVTVIKAPGYFVLNNDRVIQLKSGRLIVPVAYHRPVQTEGNAVDRKPSFYDDGSGNAIDLRGIVVWYLSDDDGKTWYESDYWWALPERDRVAGFQEPGVVELQDGSIFSWVRTDVGVQYGFYSTDKGRSFSPPERTSLISPCSPASIKRIPGTPDLLAVYNDHSGRFPYTPKRRNPLVAAISRDNGKTWENHTVIEPSTDGHYCYTAIHFAGDAVLLAYYAGRHSIGDRGALHIFRMKLSDIYTG